MADWNTAEIVVAFNGWESRRFHQVDIDDSNFLSCYREIEGEEKEYCQIKKDEVLQVYFNLNVHGHNQTILIWRNEQRYAIIQGKRKRK